MDYNQKRSQLTNLKLQKTDNSDVVTNISYDYYNGGGGSGGNNGRIRYITDHLDGNYSVDVGYDDYNRLTSYGSYRSYTYDAWNNLLSVSSSNGVGEAPNYTLTYATNGSGAPSTNRINNSGYTYDAAGRLKTAGTNNSCEYDGDGRKVKQVSGGYALFYLWSSVLGEPVVELDGSGGVYRAYVLNSGGQMLAVQSYDGGFYWLHTDHLGNGRKLTNTSGSVIYRAEFDPHGQMLYEWQSSGQTYLNSHKFTGYERDWATNLNYAKARTYNHNRARFLQPDPLGLGAADTSDPQSLNLYSYVGNDPANFVDPSGLNKVCFYTEFEYSYVKPDGTIVIGTVLRFDGCFDYGGGGGGSGVVVRDGGGGGSVGGSGGGDANKSIKQKICNAIPSGRTLGFTGGIGGVGTAVGGGEIVVNYDSGQVSAFAYGGLQFGWNGGASASVYSGYVYGLNKTNSNYSGGSTGANAAVGIGGFVASSSGGLTSKNLRNVAPNGNVTVVGASIGASLIPTPTGGVTATNYTKPLQLGKFWAFSPVDALLYAARQLCK